jgi:hypothetical protein
MCQFMCHQVPIREPELASATAVALGIRQHPVAGLTEESANPLRLVTVIDDQRVHGIIVGAAAELAPARGGHDETVVALPRQPVGPEPLAVGLGAST